MKYLILMVLLINPVRAASPLFENGDLGGAKFTLIVPQKWNGQLVLLAHGLRLEGTPLTSEVNLVKYPALAGLIREGWMIASTSYRRNGWIVDDAASDLDSLREEVIRRHGKPSITMVIGSSMGGAIGVRMAEKMDPANYQGILGLGAALGTGKSASLSFTHAPQIPLLLISNQSEIKDPRNYWEQARKAPVPPALWSVSRDGHVNLTQAEYSAGVEGLLRWIKEGKVEVQKDVTRKDPTPRRHAPIRQGVAMVRVTDVDPIYGNISTDLVAADLKALSLAAGEEFLIGYQKQQVCGRVVKAYAEVPRGTWLALVNASGIVEIARNLDNAARTLGLKKGDIIQFRKTEQPGKAVARNNSKMLVSRSR